MQYGRAYHYIGEISVGKLTLQEPLMISHLLCACGNVIFNS